MFQTISVTSTQESTLPSVSEVVPLFPEVCDDGADGFALGIGGFSLKVTAEVADAAT